MIAMTLPSNTSFAVAPVISIGDSFQGGIVAYILQEGDPGYDAGLVQGLIAATSDIPFQSMWISGPYTVTGATGTALGSGSNNTNLIIASQGPGGYAAKMCADYTNSDTGNGVYDDWYLPSKDELNKLYLNKALIGNFVSGPGYWSSSEVDQNNAWGQSFSNGAQYSVDKGMPGTDYVRPVRSFSIINFSDEDFEICVRRELGIAAPTPITTYDADGLTSLYCDPALMLMPEEKITDLSDVQYFRNLTYLFVAYNYITDIQPLLDNPGIDSGDEIYLGNNPLSYQAYLDILTLESDGVTVDYDWYCGNSIIDGSEECDDGDGDNGDGCSATCQIEPTVTVTAIDDNGYESEAGPMTFRFQRTLGTDSSLTVNFSTAGTAIRTSDYCLNVGGDSIEIPIGQSYVDLGFSGCLEDGIVEDTETIIIGVEPGAGYIVGNPDSATGTLYDGHAPSVISIPDANLEACIRTALGIPTNPITEDDALTLTSLSCMDMSISNITGLEHFTNLNTLFLDRNAIGDLTPLSGLISLIVLDLDHNSLVDISLLSELTNVQSLDLNTNSIVDITPLSGMTRLFSLNLSYNSITDISVIPWADFTLLNNVYLSDNSISSIDDLRAATSLSILHADNNAIDAVGDLSMLTSLTSLWLHNNNIGNNLGFINGLVSLHQLYLGDNSITDITSLSGIHDSAGLIELSLGETEPYYNADNLSNDNNITDITVLTGLNSLTNLSLCGNEVTNIAPLAGMTLMENLDLDNAAVSDFSSLYGMANLSDLKMYFVNITDMSFLSHFPNLTAFSFYGDGTFIPGLSVFNSLDSLVNLTLNGSDIGDLSFLNGMNSLLTLGLAENSIVDVSPLEYLTNLISLDLSANSIVDIQPLVDNAGIGDGDTLTLRSNSLSDESLALIDTLTGRGVNVVTGDDGGGGDDGEDWSVPTGDDHEFVVNINWDGYTGAPIYIAFYYGASVFDMNGGAIDGYLMVQSPGTYHAYVPHVEGQNNVVIQALSWADGDVQFGDNPDIFWLYEDSLSLFGNGPTVVDMNMDEQFYVGGIYSAMLASGVSNSTVAVNLFINSEGEDDGGGAFLMDPSSWSVNGVSPVSIVGNSNSFGFNAVFENPVDAESSLLLDMSSFFGPGIMARSVIQPAGTVSFNVSQDGDNYVSSLNGNLNISPSGDSSVASVFVFDGTILTANSSWNGSISVSANEVATPSEYGLTEARVVSFTKGNYDGSLHLSFPAVIYSPYEGFSDLTNPTVLIDGVDVPHCSDIQWTGNTIEISSDSNNLHLEADESCYIWADDVDDEEEDFVLIATRHFSDFVIGGGVFEDEVNDGGVVLVLPPPPVPPAEPKVIIPTSEPKIEEQNVEQPKVEPLKIEEPKIETTKHETPKVETPEITEHPSEKIPPMTEQQIEKILTEEGFQNEVQIKEIAVSLENQEPNVVENVLRASVDTQRMYSDSTYESNVLNFISVGSDKEKVADKDMDGISDYIEIAYGVENETPENAADKILFKVDPKTVNAPQIVNMDGKTFDKSPLILAVYKPNVDVNVFVKNLGDKKNTNNDGYFQIGTIAMDNNGRGQLQVSLDNGFAAGKYMAKLVGIDKVSGKEVSFEIADVNMNISGLTVEEIKVKEPPVLDSEVSYVIETLEQVLGKDTFDSKVFMAAKQKTTKYIVKGKIKSNDLERKMIYLTYKSTIFSSVALSDANESGEYFEIEVPNYVAKNEMHNLTAYAYAPKKNISSSAKSFQFQMK